MSIESGSVTNTNDNIVADDANDVINSGNGNDTVDGGGGNDTIRAGAGNDTLVYVLSDNLSIASTRDLYVGGAGFDTVELVLTEEQYAATGMAAQIAAYLAHIESVKNRNGEVSNGSGSDFTFTFEVAGQTSTLTVSMMESLKLTLVDSDPQVVAPETLVLSEDASSAIAGVQIAHADEGEILTVTLQVDNGTLNVDGGIAGGVGTGNITGNGTNQVALVGTAVQINVTLAALSGLVYYPAHDDSGPASLSITVNSVDSSHTAEIAISINPVADTPSLVVTNASGIEDEEIPLSINANLTDLDGSESLSITISGVPTGAVLSEGTNNNDGSWTLSKGQLAELTITPPPDSESSFVLTVTATATDGTSTASNTQTIQVAVTPVADELTQDGIAVDGYIVGATVFADANNNGMRDTGEAFTTTGASGQFTLVGGSGPLVMIGGTDISTGLAFQVGSPGTELEFAL